MITIVLIVWAANFIAPIFMPEYKPHPELNAPLMAVIAALFAKRAKSEKKETK